MATTFPLPRPLALPRRMPFTARTAAILLIWLLPFHSLIMAVLFGVLGWSGTTVRMLASWKEATVILLVIWAVGRTLGGHTARTRITAPDIAITGLIALATVYLLLQSHVFGLGMPLAAELYGYRDAVFFMLLYYAGRATPELAADNGVLRHLYYVALVVSVIGILERLFVSPEVLVVIGVATYMNDFLGLGAFTEGNEFGLPQNYWTYFGGMPIRRAGSVFLHSQGFALPFLLLIPAATAWALNRARDRSAWLRIGYVLIWLGLALSITRMTIAICLVQMCLFYLIVRRPEWTAATVMVGAVAFLAAMLVIPGVFTFVWETVTWQSSSSESHMKEWLRGTVAIGEKPWGHGLGTTDQVAVRFGMVPVTGDNMYFAYSAQMGLLGLLAQVGALVSILWYSWRLTRDAATPALKRMGIVMVLTTIGIMLNGATSLVFSSTLLAVLFFWFAGSVVTNAETSRRG
jgi:hypothetical protein